MASAKSIAGLGIDHKEIAPTMASLLAGSKNRRNISVAISQDDNLMQDEIGESGILMLPFEEEFPDDTTNPDESGDVRKPKRSARRCKWCNNFSRGSTNLCARHGGGRRCHCGKLARGPSNLCMKHGGGRRCLISECMSAAVYKSDYCRGHGGGKRCCVDGCVASVYSSREDKCFRHGGGRRCTHVGCSKAPVGKTDYCIKHGGGKRCSIDDCHKGAVCEGLCVKHHQDAYRLEAKPEIKEEIVCSGSNSSSSTPSVSASSSTTTSPLRVVQTGTTYIQDIEDPHV